VKDTLTILKEAYALISDRSRWTTYVAARDADGRQVDPWSKNAVRFCAAGACWCVAEVESLYDKSFVSDAHEELRRTLGQQISITNDGPNGYDRICEAFRDTIARLSPANEPVTQDDRELVEA